MNTKFDGILLIDKPENITSFNVCEILKKRFRLKKIGHSGTLDPFATGLLILGVNAGTRLLKYFSEFPKEYSGTIILGEKKDTFDLTGKTIEKKEVNISEKEINSAIKHFLGTIKQKPPIYSALKKNGKPLYKYAREGKEVEIKERLVFIEKFEITNINLPEINFLIKCSKGTYIRSIANDLGEKLGTYAYLKTLRRTAINGYNVKNAHKLEKVSLENLIPFEDSLKIPKFQLKPEYSKLLENGNLLEISYIENFEINNINNSIFYVTNLKCIGICSFYKEKNVIKPEIVYKKSLH